MTFYKATCATYDPILRQFWNPKWTKLGGQLLTRKGQDEPKGPSVASKSFFKNLKKPQVFTRFLGPEASQENLKEKTCKKKQFKRAEKS